jgi:hypothetical protein
VGATELALVTGPQERMMLCCSPVNHSLSLAGLDSYRHRNLAMDSLRSGQVSDAYQWDEVKGT